MSAAEQAGLLPEIVNLIIEFLEFDRAALYSAHLVNTTWAHYARKVLWRNAPFVSLAGVDPCRQQFYANMIHTSHTWPAWWHAELDRLSFPSLKRFLFNLTYVFYCPEYRRLLPPCFKAFPQYLDLWVKCRAPGNRTAYDGHYESRVGGNLLARRTAGSIPTRKINEVTTEKQRGIQSTASQLKLTSREPRLAKGLAAVSCS